MSEKPLPARSEIPREYRWNLEDIYPSPADWEREAQEVQDLLPQVQSYRGRLGTSAALLAEALEFRDRVSRKAEKLFVYARMRRDEDNADAAAQARADKAEGLITRVRSAFSFYTPEILTIPEESLRAWVQKEPRLMIYRHHIEEITKKRPHILSQDEEKILAELGEVLNAADTAFIMLDNADLEFEPVRNGREQILELTRGRYQLYMESPDRRLRQEAFFSLHRSYQRHINAIAAMLAGAVKRDAILARLRRYGSALEAGLDQDNVPVKVYEELIAAVRQALPALHRYFALKKKKLGLDELHVYDLYAPLVPEADWKVDYREAKNIVLESLAPLGEDYAARLRQGLEGGWIDVFENRNKTGGAYAWGCYDSHPYVLLNYQPGLNSLLTLAHEMGHAMHSAYSNANQAYINAEYSILLAEVASTVNEILVLQELIRKSRDPKLRLYLLNRLLEEFRTTVFRQTMFAEFEWEIHRMVEAGEALTPESLSETYWRLNRIYHGEGVALDEGLKAEWARIPHFYTGFYVYKYATGFSAAVALVRAIQTEGKTAADRYLEFLKSGNSDYPLELLRRAGVDLTTPVPVAEALKVFGDTLERLEREI